ncbi:MAG: hypothetical protein AUK32_09985 [Candidatus Aquicultor secundus]|nr:diguanylate cyclase [Candidatus Aquicultor secundus]NCO66726.1 diguanylate cyclase [Solirubrobacter sp.]OIO83457.1 MAG: hypothetical protein AUK32_09985 [Candidatus Aquicultor secundus]
MHKPTKRFHNLTGSCSASKSGQTEGVLCELEEACRALVDNVGVAIFHTDSKGNIFEANKMAIELAGYTKEELLDMNASQFLSNKDFERLLDLKIEEIPTGYYPLRDTLLLEKDGHEVPADLMVSIVEYKGSRIFQILASDITEHRRRHDSLLEAKERVEQIYNIIPSAIFTVDTNNNLTSFNKAAEEITGFSAKEIIGKKCTTFAVGPCARGCGLLEFADQIDEPIIGKICEIETKSGEIRIISKNMDILRDTRGNVIGGVESFEDITERKIAEETIKYMAYYDSLTGLPNRTLFNDRLSAALGHAHRNNERLAVLFIDLDNFKIINDTLGHAVGDELLQAVAERLKKCVRIEDTIARLGGDEFVIMSSRVDNPEHAAALAKRLLETIRPPFNLEERDFHITTSIGIALYPNDGEDNQALLKNADTALYSAKGLGRNNYQFYESTMNIMAS